VGEYVSPIKSNQVKSLRKNKKKWMVSFSDWGRPRVMGGVGRNSGWMPFSFFSEV
jgi:hypothetical protein